MQVNASLLGGALLLAFACGAVVDAVVDEAFEANEAAKVMSGHATVPLVYIDKQETRKRFSSPERLAALRIKRLLP